MKIINSKATAIIVSTLLLTSFAANAIPAKPGWRTVTQPDGTELKVRVVGDEKGHYTLDEKGRILSLQADGFYHYATLNSDGVKVSTGIIAKPDNSLSQSENAVLSDINYSSMAQTLDSRINANTKFKSARAQNQKMFASEAYYWNTARDSGFRMLTTNFPSTGNPKTLIILVNFSDVSFTVPDPHSFFDNMLNKKGYTDNGHCGSVRDYFDQSSKGQFIPQFDVFGPVTLSKKMSYYGENGGDYDEDLHPEEVVIEACKALDDKINFKDYDLDGDGFVDNIYVFYAGYGEADGGSSYSIWPHAWYILSGAGTVCRLDGVMIDHYAMSNELAGGKGYSPSGIGTFTHEFSHVMGLPDLYSVSYNNCLTPNDWNVLDYGPYLGDGKYPPLYSSFERFSLGWVRPTELYNCDNLVFEPIADTNQCFITYTNQAAEFFLFEYRKTEGFDKYLPNSGMLIWHVDFKQTVWNRNQVNDTPSHQYVDLVEAYSKATAYNLSSMCWPGSRNITTFSPTTEPAFVDWNGKSLETTISNIKLQNGILTAKVESPNTGVGMTFDNDTSLDYLISGLTIKSECDGIMDIYDLFGRKMASLSNGNSATMPNTGLYIIRNGKNSKKIYLK